MYDENSNILLVRRLLEGMLDPSNIEMLDQFFSKTIRLHGPMRGYENGYEVSLGKEVDNRLASTLKKQRLDLPLIFAHEDKVIVYWILYATSKGDDKEVVISGSSIYRITDGKISEVWESWDRLGLLEQMAEVRARSDMDLEASYDTLSKLGMEKYAQRALRLSARERQCLAQLLKGKTAKETASTLKLSYRTIEFYLDNIKTKLHCENKRDLLKMAQILSKLSLL